MTPPASPRPTRARQNWSLYLVRTAAGALYTGIALDVAARFAAHAAGRGAKALRGRGPLQLVLEVRVGGKGAALRLEARMKRLGKAAKERCVQTGLPASWLAAARRAGRAACPTMRRRRLAMADSSGARYAFDDGRDEVVARASVVAAGDRGRAGRVQPGHVRP